MTCEDLSNEKQPKKRRLIPEGWRKQKIVSVEGKESNNKNPMFVFGLYDEEFNYVTDYYAINVPGKRWNLKTIMDACDGQNKDGEYDLSELSIKSVTLNKEVECFFEHEENEWVNREGETINTEQHNINGVRKESNSQVKELGFKNPDGVNDPEEIAWTE